MDGCIARELLPRAKYKRQQEHRRSCRIIFSIPVASTVAAYNISRHINIPEGCWPCSRQGRGRPERCSHFGSPSAVSCEPWYRDSQNERIYRCSKENISRLGRLGKFLEIYSHEQIRRSFFGEWLFNAYYDSTLLSQWLLFILRNIKSFYFFLFIEGNLDKRYICVIVWKMIKIKMYIFPNSFCRNCFFFFFLF